MMRVRFPLQDPVICIVTRIRGAAGSPDRQRLLERLAAGADAGASMIQIRERQMDDADLLAFVGDLLERTDCTRTVVLLNDRLDVALAARADGVHLKSDAPRTEAVRAVAGELLVGRSVHSVPEAVAAELAGADYLLFGTVYPSASKGEGHPVAGVGALRQVCEAVEIPVMAIGGITPHRVSEVARAGAAGVAAIGLFAEAPDIALTVRQVRDSLTLSRGNV